MENELKYRPKMKDEYGTAWMMSSEERRISFMNRYFMYRKVRNVDSKKMSDVIIKQSELLDRIGEDNITEMEKIVEESPSISQENPIQTGIPKKIKRKLILTNYDPINEVVNEDKNVQKATKEIETKDSEPVEVTEFKIIGEPMRLKVNRRK
jgi:chorismate mutase